MQASQQTIALAPSRSYRNYVIALVSVGFLLNFLDRQILTLLLQPLKKEFGVSDTSLGFLSGFAFAAFYVTLGIPIARLADRSSRRAIMVASIAVWSLATSVCGLVQSFAQLVVARVGVGVGEAGFTPAAFSLIADYVPPERRATSVGFATLGLPIGVVAGLLVGGIGLHFYGWRAAFLIAGLPGLLFAVLVAFTLKEPIRGSLESRAKILQPQRSLLQSLGPLWRCRTYRFIVVANCANTMALYGLSTWIPTFIIRSLKVSPSSVGYMLAPALGVAGALGLVLGGFLGDKLAKRTAGHSLWLCAVAAIVAIPLVIASVSATQAMMVVVLYAFAYLLALVYSGPTVSMIYGVIPADLRAFSIGVLLFAVNLIGLGLGPVIVGALSDRFAPSPDALGRAMQIMSFIYVPAAMFYLIAARYAEYDMATNAGKS